MYEYFEKGKETVVGLLKSEVENSVKHVESLMNSKFGDPSNPLLMSVRSGARASMPGMMDTILNLGLNDVVVEGLAKRQAMSVLPTIAIVASYRCMVMSYWA